MNELRERIADVIGEDMSRDTELWHPEAKYTQADRILALIAEAMLSDSAVIAAENAGQPDSVLGVHHHCGTDAVQAALAAAGITPGVATICDYVNISIDPGLPNGTIAFTNHDGKTEYVKITTDDAREGGDEAD